MRVKLTNLIYGLVIVGSLSSLTYGESCIESRLTLPVQNSATKGEPNLRCSEDTGAVLLWQDPFSGTVPMPAMPEPWQLNDDNAVIRPISQSLVLYPVCGVACHNGVFPPVQDSVLPRPLTMHQDIVPDALNLQHGNGAIWCLDCHHPTERKSLVDNFGQTLPIDASPALCGKCHGQTYADWRDGLHGKRIGDWQVSAKQRWWTCSECHNPHDVINGQTARGFNALRPEPAPTRPASSETDN